MIKETGSRKIILFLLRVELKKPVRHFSAWRILMGCILFFILLSSLFGCSLFYSLAGGDAEVEIVKAEIDHEYSIVTVDFILTNTGAVELPGATVYILARLWDREEEKYREYTLWGPVTDSIPPSRTVLGQAVKTIWEMYQYDIDGASSLVSVKRVDLGL